MCYTLGLYCNYGYRGSESLLKREGTTVLCTVPGIIDRVFVKSSQNARFLLSENERFGLVFVKTGSINSRTGGLGIYLMTKTGGGRKIFLTRAKAESNLAADQHLLSPLLKPLLRR
jgi:hypothetical protein